VVGGRIALVRVGVVFGRGWEWLDGLVGVGLPVARNAKSRDPSGDQLGQGASPGPQAGADR
jgi:hypothetical protein